MCFSALHDLNVDYYSMQCMILFKIHKCCGGGGATSPQLQTLNKRTHYFLNAFVAFCTYPIYIQRERENVINKDFVLISVTKRVDDRKAMGLNSTEKKSKQ